MMKHKKLFAVLTLVCFLFTFLPVAAMADDAAAVYPDDVVAAVTIGEETTTYSSLQYALNAAVAGTGNVTVAILKDIDLNGASWTPVTVSATGYPMVTVNGNNKTISGLTDMLFASTWAGESGLIINDLTIKDSTIVNDENDNEGNVGVGAFIGAPGASKTITLNNCHLINSTVSGGHWTGGLIGWANGYSGPDGPVFTTVTVKDCSVINSTITGKGSAGAIIGHGAGDAWTKVDIVDTEINGNTITSTGTSTNKAGIVMGTIGAAGKEKETNGIKHTGGMYVDVVESENNATSNGTTITTVYGRQGSTDGVLTITGGSYENYPIESGVAYAKIQENYCVGESADGMYSVAEHEIKSVAGNDATCTEDGIAAHYTCENCGSLYSDEKGTTFNGSTVIPATGHTLIPVPKVDATYSAAGMKAHNKCEPCGKLFVDGIEVTAEELVIAKLTPSYSGITSSSNSSDKTESSTTTTTTPNGSTVETTTETKTEADGTKVETETTTTTTASGETTKVEKTTETAKDGATVETTTTTDANGETSTTVTATLENGSAVTNNDETVEVEVEAVEEAVVEAAEEAAAADAAQTGFAQPMSVSVPVDNKVLNNVTDTSKLTLAKVVTNADGTTSLEYMGGSYDKETGTFNAKVDEDGDYILVEKADLVKIELNIDKKDVKHNDKAGKLDVAPQINEKEGRTELPLRYLGEALGFGIDWNNNVVTITKGGISFSLTIGEEIPGYGTPYVEPGADRTMVSARYISEKLGANVIWDPVARQVIVVK